MKQRKWLIANDVNFERFKEEVRFQLLIEEFGLGKLVMTQKVNKAID
jgi:hypothetical protein